MKKRKMWENRAQLQPGPESAQDCTDCECCCEELVFAMQDTQHQFSIGLFTILDCLKIAEKQGYVPPLPDDWWLLVRGR